MNLEHVRYVLEHDPFVNYILGCLVTAGAVWLIDKILKSK